MEEQEIQVNKTLEEIWGEKFIGQCMVEDLIAIGVQVIVCVALAFFLAWAIQMEILYRVVAKHFVAGFILDDGIVVHAAPILRYLIGQRERRVMKYLHKKGWQVRRV